MGQEKKDVERLLVRVGLLRGCAVNHTVTFMLPVCAG